MRFAPRAARRFMRDLAASQFMRGCAGKRDAEFSQKWRAAPGAPNILPHLPCSLVLLPKREVFTIFSFPLWA
jgi:hypothetical protein